MIQENVPIFQLQPQTMDNYDWDFLSRELSEGSDAPQEGFLDPEVVQKIRQQRAAQAAQQQQMEAMAQAAPAQYRKLASPGVVPASGSHSADRSAAVKPG